MKETILKNIKKIDDIKKLSLDELKVLAEEVRERIIDVVSKNGGHLASSLGTVELTIALLYSLDLPKDKVIWDVGHQSYAYKILTDRKDNFDTLRTFGGISGFPKREESKYDVFNTGHSSTSISAGLGISHADNMDNVDSTVVSVIGDGSLTGGEAFEALNNCRKLDKNFIIILNDNEMSISKSDGGLNHALMEIRISNGYITLKKHIDNILKKIIFGEQIKNAIITFNKAVKQIFVSRGMMFENFDIVYLKTIDGHNIKQLINTINKAKKINKPCIIHIVTKKGKGYKYAENNPTKFHGVAPFDKATGEIISKSTAQTYSDVFGETICDIAKENKNVVCITAAMTEGTGLLKFSKEYTDRFFDVEICEQHAVTFAGGLAVENKIPVVCIYSTFLQRAFDQIVHDICLQNLHVVFMVDRAGIVGADGATHQGIFDIAFLKILPNMVVMSPKNDVEFKKMINFAINKLNCPVAIRFPRGKAETDFKKYDNEISLGKAEIIKDDGDIVLYSFGSMLKYTLAVSDKLKEVGLNSKIINARFANPIDKQMINKLCNDAKLFVTLEEGVKYGSMGESVCAYINEHFSNVQTDIIALPNDFIEQGSKEQIFNLYNMDEESTAKKIISRYKNING